MTTAMTLGVEEEFFLIDPESRNLLADPDPRIFRACEANAAPHKVVHEFLRSQIETTPASAPPWPRCAMRFARPADWSWTPPNNTAPK